MMARREERVNWLVGVSPSAPIGSVRTVSFTLLGIRVCKHALEES